MSQDRIEKTIVLKATRERVWAAISDSARFGAWFGAEFDGPFTEGERLNGRIMPTKVDPEVAKLQEPAKGMACIFVIDRIEPMRRFSFRWHPFAVDRDYDYSQEPMTLIVFELTDADAGTRLTITEAGFKQLPPERREAALKANDGGWTHQCKLIEKYLAIEAQA